MTIILIIAIAVFCYAGFQLYKIFHTYKASNDEYDKIASSYTMPYEGSSSNGSTDNSTDSSEKGIKAEASGEEYEDADPPLSVDWEALKSINPDITGWIYIDALSSISYPVCKGTDNEYYLHKTFEKQDLFSGAIFEDYSNASDFSDPNTIIYGHNMKNQSMFGKLKFLKEQETFDKSHYMWILTPEGNYRYRIFAVFDTDYDSDVYTQFNGRGSIFPEWAEKMKGLSEVNAGDMTFNENDFVVTLSTCTSNDNVRCVVLAKCVSSDRPVVK